MSETLDIAVVGAGAAGLMAAIAAARAAPGARIVAFDGADRIGAKILIAGGGRCNVTHREVGADDFHGSSRNAIAKILRTLSIADTIAFFRGIGVELKEEETGKLFPTTDRAKTVLDALLGACRDAGSEVRPGARVTSIRRDGEGFALTVEEGKEVQARRVVLASGGRSVPKTGSDGAGYELARRLGHSVAPTFPALVPLMLPAGHWMTELRGASCNAEVRVRAESGKVYAAVTGSMLMTHFGLSGPAILDISRHLAAARMNDDSAGIEISFFPAPPATEAPAPESSRAVAKVGGATFDDVILWMRDQAISNPHSAIRNLFLGVLPERVADAVIRFAADLDPSLPFGRLPRDAQRSLARAATGLAVPISRDRGWDFAEVTAGGIPLGEIQLATMESRVVADLYFCGEICDVDGRIGGFNFQWAWASGKLAGEGAAAGDLSSGQALNPPTHGGGG
ncbi:MAG: NAD(P)/FAD-dependent oxidoreductase [Thermoanaerobaculia bacterium]